MPLVAPTLDYVYRMHLREQIRHAAFAAGDFATGDTPAAEMVTVGIRRPRRFHRARRGVPPEELGNVTGASTSSPARSPPARCAWSS